MRKRKVPDYGEFAGSDVRPLDAESLAWLESLLRERNAAPDNTRRKMAEDTIRETLHERGLHEFTTTDGKRVHFRFRVHPQPGVSDERLNAFLIANGQRAYGNAGRWAWRLVDEGRAIPAGFDEHFRVVWRMEVQ